MPEIDKARKCIIRKCHRRTSWRNRVAVYDYFYDETEERNIYVCDEHYPIIRHSDWTPVPDIKKGRPRKQCS